MDRQFTPKDNALYWDQEYKAGRFRWHRGQPHQVLINHYNKLNPDSKVRKVLVTMCGMSEDMNWLENQGLEVVGIDLSIQALSKFMSTGDHRWTEKRVEKLGQDAKLFTRDDGKIKLYCGNALDFSSEFEGKFDAIYDCDGIHSLPKPQCARMAEMLKGVLNPGGRFLLEAVDYDPKILEQEDLNIESPVPPPYPMNLKDVTTMFEPECTVQHIETNTALVFCLRETEFKLYLITKK